MSDSASYSVWYNRISVLIAKSGCVGLVAFFLGGKLFSFTSLCVLSFLAQSQTFCWEQ